MHRCTQMGLRRGARERRVGESEGRSPPDRGDQKLNFRANWKLRCGSALKNAVELIRPALVLLLPGTPTSESGLPRFTWLKRLTASMRISSRLRPRQPDVLEERRVRLSSIRARGASSSPCPQRFRGAGRENALPDEPIGVALNHWSRRLRTIGVAGQVRPIVAARIAVGARVPVVDAEREPALDDRVRVELPAADERIRERERRPSDTVCRARSAARPRAKGRNCACGPNRLVPCSSRRRRRSSPPLSCTCRCKRVVHLHGIPGREPLVELRLQRVIRVVRAVAEKVDTLRPAEGPAEAEVVGDAAGEKRPAVVLRHIRDTPRGWAG